MLKILFLGDVTGEPGRRAVIESVPRLKKERHIDFVIVNGENAAAGRGITPRITIDLLRAGVSVVTTGDHIWDQKEIIPYIDTEPRLLRPVNYPEKTPGQGSVILETAKGKVAVLNVQGRTFMLPILENPFRILREEVERLRRETNVIFVDAHAETPARRSRSAVSWTARYPQSSARTRTFRRRTKPSFPGARRSCATRGCAAPPSRSSGGRSSRSSRGS